MGWRRPSSLCHDLIFSWKVLLRHISFFLNHDKKQNKVNHLLFPVTIIVTNSFKPFPDSKYQNLQKVLFRHCSIGNHIMLLQLLWHDHCPHGVLEKVNQGAQGHLSGYSVTIVCTEKDSWWVTCRETPPGTWAPGGGSPPGRRRGSCWAIGAAPPGRGHRRPWSGLCLACRWDS